MDEQELQKAEQQETEHAGEGIEQVDENTTRTIPSPLHTEEQ